MCRRWPHIQVLNSLLRPRIPNSAGSARSRLRWPARSSANHSSQRAGASTSSAPCLVMRWRTPLLSVTACHTGCAPGDHPRMPGPSWRLQPPILLRRQSIHDSCPCFATEYTATIIRGHAAAVNSSGYGFLSKDSTRANIKPIQAQPTRESST